MKEKAIIITAPSGAGKTTLVKKLLASRTDLAFSVSACTRDMRQGEQDGVDYYFLYTQEFQRKIQANEFLEWEEVYKGMFYGTLRSEVNRIWTNGQAVIFDIDVKGAKHLKAQLGEKARAIFIAPPSVEVLKERLQGRGTESEESLKKRLDKYLAEMAYEKDMDLTVVNDDLEKAFTELSHRVNEFLQN